MLVGPEDLPNADLPIGNSKCSSGDNSMFVQDFELKTQFCLKGPKNLFELTNFELLDRLCLDLIVSAQGAEIFVRISESSNYRVFELTDVDCNYLGKLHCVSVL